MTDATGTNAADDPGACSNRVRDKDDCAVGAGENCRWPECADEKGGCLMPIPEPGMHAIPNRVASDTGPQSELDPEGRTVIWDADATPNRATAYDIARDGCNAHGGCIDAAVCLAQGGCTRVREAPRA